MDYLSMSYEFRLYESAFFAVAKKALLSKKINWWFQVGYHCKKNSLPQTYSWEGAKTNYLL